MSHPINRVKHTIVSLVLIIATLLSSQAAFAKNDDKGHDGDKAVKIIPVNGKVQGKSYREWSAAWWQWAFSVPADQSPFFDENGSCAHGRSGQSGKLWYLAGVFNVSGQAERNCTIPEDKFLFFPVLNVECDNLTPPTLGGNEADLRACAHSYQMVNLAAEIDGVAITNLDRYVVDSPLFTITLPENNLLGLPAGSGNGVSNGAWLMLAPLSEGQHTIHFSGTFPAFGFTLNITYHLTVGDGEHEEHGK